MNKLIFHITSFTVYAAAAFLLTVKERERECGRQADQQHQLV